MRVHVSGCSEQPAQSSPSEVQITAHRGDQVDLSCLTNDRREEETLLENHQQPQRANERVCVSCSEASEPADVFTVILNHADDVI